MNEAGRRNALLKEYSEVASNFRNLTDIRFKLLGFLPLASLAAVALAVAKGDLAGLGTFVLALFGLAATVGLAIYNSRNDQIYDELVGRAARIERHLGLQDGSFANRPRAWVKLNLAGVRQKIDHRAAIGIIYAASAALWLALLFAAILELARRVLHSFSVPGFDESAATTMQAFALLLAVAVMSQVVGLIRKQVRDQRSRLRRCAACAYKIARKRDRDALKDSRFIKLCAWLLDDKQRRTTEARAAFYSSPEASKDYLPVRPEKQPAASNPFHEDSAAGSVYPANPEERASLLVALLTDLPPGWIADCGEDRKGLVADARAKACLRRQVAKSQGRKGSGSRSKTNGQPAVALLVVAAACIGLLFGLSSRLPPTAAGSGTQTAPTPGPLPVYISGINCLQAENRCVDGAPASPGPMRAVAMAAMAPAGWGDVGLSPFLFLGLTLLASGVGLLFFQNRWTKAAGAIAFTIGALFSGAALIREVKIDSVFKLDEVTLVKVERGQSWSAATSGFEWIGGIEKFRLGSPDRFEDGVDTEGAYQKIVQRWLQSRKEGKEGALLFVGATDEVPLARTARSRYEGNVGLARARAETVKSRFIEAVSREDKDFDPKSAKFLVLVSGPRQLRMAGTDPKRQGTAVDRRVDVWAFWSERHPSIK